MNDSLKQYKKPYERAVKKSVSMPELLFDRANDKRREKQLPTFSDYLQDLIRKDLESKQQAA